MQQRMNNSKSTMDWHSSVHQRNLTTFVFFCFISLVSQPLLSSEPDSEGPDADTQKAILQLPTVTGAVSALGKLNQAMETAAKNPNDEWRREEVRKAMQSVPQAVQALAGTFASHTMANSSLPFVLSLLGSSVDVNAPNSFDKFLKNPVSDSRSMTVADPASASNSKKELSLILNERHLERTSTALQAPFSPTPQSDTVVLDFSVQNPGIHNLERTPASSSFSVDTHPVKTQPSRSPYLETVEPRAPQIEESSSLLKSIGADISQAENVVKELEELKADDESFFKKKKSPIKKEKEARRPIGPVSSVEAALIYVAENLLSRDAFANSGTNNPLNGSPTNPQDGNGGGAGQFLFGAAQIIAAISPMIVANTEAQKEQNITQIETQAQIKQAEIQTQTQKEMAQLSAQTSLAQAKAQQDIAVLNNNAQSERLQLNLMAAQQQRNEERQAQTQQIMMQQQIEAQKLALAQAQADETIRLARQNLESQRLQAALDDTGLAPSALSQAQASLAGSSLAGGNPLASALAAQALSGDSNLGGMMPTGSLANSIRGIRRTGPASSDTLLASALAPEQDLEMRSQVKNKASQRRRVPLSNSRGAYRNGLSLTAAGSFSTQRRALRGRDLTQFTQQSRNPLEEGFSRRVPIRALSSTH